MEMIDVIKKLEEIASKSPEVAKAIESTEAMNPKEVDENAVQSDKSIAQNDQEVSEEVTDKINEFKVGSYKDFLASKGVDIYNLKGDQHVKYAKMYRDAKNQKHQDATAKKGTDDHKTYTPSTADTPAKIEGEANEGGMSDIHIGAQEELGNYLNDDGDLDMPKAEVLQKMAADAKKVPFPRSYEIETAMDMVRNDFQDNGARRPDMEPAMDAEQPADEGNAFAQAVQKAKAAGMKKGDKFKVGDEEHTLRDSDFEVNTQVMKTEDKKQVNEAIQISTDSPEEAGIMMQILKLAGVQQVTPDMMGADEPHDHDGMTHSHPGGDQEHSHDKEMGMDKMRDLVQKSQEEPADEAMANSPEIKHQDTDYMLNKISGGLNKQKQQVRKEYPGDNPLAVEDTISEEDLSNQLRNAYEEFKSNYAEAVAEAKAKPDYLDMDKDGDKSEPMKKAIKDKEAK
tara:strand:+ start:2469 stop:3830 length:1362 start_codon:yes stop_codon:yes gene_type:complete